MHGENLATLVYEYDGGRDRFPNISDEMMEGVDKADSAQFCKEDILDPQGLGALELPYGRAQRSGPLPRFRISNYQLLMQLIDHCLEHSVDEILELPDVQERAQPYRAHEQPFRGQLARCAPVHDTPRHARSARRGDHLRRQPLHV